MHDCFIVYILIIYIAHLASESHSLEDSVSMCLLPELFPFHQAFASNLACKHYNRSIQQKCWDAWHSIVEARWRSRVERACQAKAQEVCMALTNDYEVKIASVSVMSAFFWVLALNRPNQEDIMHHCQYSSPSVIRPPYLPRNYGHIR